jgi:hypothetical protein
VLFRSLSQLRFEKHSEICRFKCFEVFSNRMALTDCKSRRPVNQAFFGFSLSYYRAYDYGLVGLKNDGLNGFVV